MYLSLLMTVRLCVVSRPNCDTVAMWRRKGSRLCRNGSDICWLKNVNTTLPSFNRRVLDSEFRPYDDYKNSVVMLFVKSLEIILKL